MQTRLQQRELGFREGINRELKIKRIFTKEGEIDEHLRRVTKIIQAARSNIRYQARLSNDKIPKEITDITKRRNRVRKRFQKYREEEAGKQLKQLEQEVNTRLWTYWEYR